MNNFAGRLIIFLLLFSTLISIGSCSAKKNNGYSPGSDENSPESNGIAIIDEHVTSTSWVSEVIEKGRRPQIRVDPSGVIQLVFINDTENNIIWLTKLNGNWEQKAPRIIGFDPQLALDPKGGVNISFLKESEQHPSVYIAEWIAKKWSVDIGAHLFSKYEPYSFAINSNGVLAVANHDYYEGYDDDGNFYVLSRIFYHYRTMDGEWNTEEADNNDWVVSAASCALAFNSFNLPYVVHTATDSGDTTLFATWKGNNQWITVDIGYPITASDFHLSLRMDDLDNAYLCYHDGLGINYGRTIDSVWHIGLIESEGMNKNCSLAVDAQGHAFISYYHEDETSGGVLRFAENIDGEWQTRPLGPAGENSSIALDPDGYIHIAYEKDGSIYHLMSPEPYGTPAMKERPGLLTVGVARKCVGGSR